MYDRIGKRAIDVTLGLLALLLLLPVLIVVAAAIKIEDRGPILFRQLRVGRDELLFVILKFRSMPTSTESLPSASLAAPKVTRVGRVIRRLNVDELPQLFLILTGTMSLVGPRPALESQHELIRARKTNGAFRVRPGLTGLAQVHSYDAMPDDVKAAYDAEYAAAVTFRQDVSIILRTFLYLLRPPPTY